MVSVALGWQVYDATHDPFVLGLIGLLQFLPSLFLFLVSGSVADRYSRRLIFGLCSITGCVCACVFTLTAAPGLFNIWVIYSVLVLLGIMRAFLNPAVQSLAPNLVPVEEVASAVAWTSSSTKTAQIVGPVAGGFLYAFSAYAPYFLSAVFFASAASLISLIKHPSGRVVGVAPTWEAVTAGFRFIVSEKVVLGAISLDMFAVLLGGAVALMPIFAQDVLNLGPFMLGLLRAAPAVGAIAMAIYLAVHPVKRRAGFLMFLSVFIFAITTIVFGLSTSPWLSVVTLILLGAADMVSVYIRTSLIALWTPDNLRGRVNAVNQVFVGASNELGAFRAGAMAASIGAVPAVLFGGVGTIVIGALWMGWFPKLRKIEALDGQKNTAQSEASPSTPPSKIR